MTTDLSQLNDGWLRALQTPGAKHAFNAVSWFTRHSMYIPHTCLYYGHTDVLRRKHLHWFHHHREVNPRRAKYAMRTAERYWNALRRRQVSHPQETKRFIDLILPPQNYVQNFAS